MGRHKEEEKTLEEAIERIKGKTIYVFDCWLFGGAKNNQGYGMIRFNSKTVTVHRISAACYLGLNLNDSTQQANHKMMCVNKECWRPEHLYVGNAKSNAQDVVNWGENHNSVKIYCKRGHEFTPENTYEYLNTRDGTFQRRCKTCQSEHLKQYREKHGQL